MLEQIHMLKRGLLGYACQNMSAEISDKMEYWAPTTSPCLSVRDPRGALKKPTKKVQQSQ